MPTSAASLHPDSRREDLIGRLSSCDSKVKLQALRELKNQIIGNRTKKFSFLKLGAVPSVVSVLSSSCSAGFFDEEVNDSLIIQSATTIGSFACGFDAGVKAVIEAGALPLLLNLLSNANEKVVDAGARSLKLIYQSKLAPKFDFLQPEKMEFLLSLLNSENENVTGLGASIVTHSSQTAVEKKVLSDAGVVDKLASLLAGSLSQRDASLESLAAVVNSNPDAVVKFMDIQRGRSLGIAIELTTDKYPRTRLLACIFLTILRNTSPSCVQDAQIASKLVTILLELLDDPNQVGDEAPFALSQLIVGSEALQVVAFEANSIDRLCKHLQTTSLTPKRLQGIFLVLADLCSRLECCRDAFLLLEGLKYITLALSHDATEVRAAACICLKNVSRSVKNLSAGHFMNESLLVPLIQLLYDQSTSVQVAALGAISNIVIDFTEHKSKFIQFGGLKQLIQLSKSMDPIIRMNAMWALRNLIFLANSKCKEEIMLELTPLTLTSLVCDSEASVQEQALAFVSNLIDGPVDAAEYVFAEDGLLLHAIERQINSTARNEVLVQAVRILSNMASGDELQKEAVMHLLFPATGNDSHSVMIKFLQSNDGQLRTAAVWAIVNLTLPSSPGAYGRVVKLKCFDVGSQLKNLVNDPCLDVKLRARTALGQLMTFGDGST